MSSLVVIKHLNRFLKRPGCLLKTTEKRAGLKHPGQDFIAQYSVIPQGGNKFHITTTVSFSCFFCAAVFGMTARESYGREVAFFNPIFFIYRWLS